MSLGELAGSYLEAHRGHRGRPAAAHQRLHRGRLAAHPHQEPGAAAAQPRPGGGRRTRGPTRRRRFACGSSSTAGIGTRRGRLAALLARGRRDVPPGAVAAAARRPARAPSAPPPRPLDPASLPRALERWIQVALPLDEPPVVMVRTVTLVDRARVIREALREAPALVLQDLLAGVTDRVVVAITFLAMLELVKGRELIVEQAEPWGPISVRRRDGMRPWTPPMPGQRCRRRRRPVAERARCDPDDAHRDERVRRPRRGRPAPDARRRARPGGAPVRGRAAAVAARDRPAVRHRPRGRGRAAGRPGGRAARPGHPADDGRRARRADHGARGGPAHRSLCRAATGTGSRRRPWRRSPSWPIASP